MSSILGGGGKTETVQNSAPWGPSQSNMIDVFNKGSDQYYRNYGNGGVSQQLGQGLDLQQQRGLMGSPLTQSAQQMTQNTLNGNYLNPYTSGAMGDAMNMTRASINGQFKGDNNGNSAHQEWLGRGLLNASMPFANQSYEAERGRQMQAAGMAPGLANNDYTDIGNVLASAQTRDAAPWNNLFNYQKSVQSGGGDSLNQQPYYQNQLGNAMGLGMAGMGMYGMGQGFGWWGA